MKKIAIVHEWFVTFAGSEKVVEQLLHIFPDADLYGLVDFMQADARGWLGGKPVQTSILQKFPFISEKNYRNYLPFMPMAIEQIDLSDYEIIISNCHAVTKGVITSPDQLHISYIHSPMRYAWDLQNTYLRNSGFGMLKDLVARSLLHSIRQWDFIAAQRPDRIWGNSNFIMRRIKKIYRREALPLYPPVDTDSFTFSALHEDFYLAASRLVPYKRFDVIIRAFENMPDKKLVIIGDGPDAHLLKRMTAPNITWLGYQPDDVLREYMQRCKAFIFAAKEDFGIMPIEAQACGAPVIGFGEGGLTETIVGLGADSPTGVFFHPQTAEALQEAVRTFEANAGTFTAENCRKNAERFSNERFRREAADLVETAWREFRGSVVPPLHLR